MAGDERVRGDERTGDRRTGDRRNPLVRWLEGVHNREIFGGPL